MQYILKYNTRELYEYDYSIGKIIRPHVCLIGGIELQYVPLYNPTPDSESPLYIEALQDLTIKFSNNYEYSLDNTEWLSATSSTSIIVTAGNRAYFRASGLTATSSTGIGKFTISNGNANVGGNVMSMIYGENYIGKTELTQDYALSHLFYQQSKIISAKSLSLPSEKLRPYCYYNMFFKCTDLEDAPLLPALGTESRCYCAMFSGCTKLQNVPNLPATVMSDWCYTYMFQDCTNLKNAPALPAITLASACYSNMFKNCTSLVNAPALPAETMANSCYSSMFYGCTSLVNAPALPAETMFEDCYMYMFSGCTSLVNAPALPAVTMASRCYSSMFKNCTSLVNAPALPAITLVSYCYGYMFEGCTSLRYIKALFTSTPSSTYTSNWVKDVSTTGIFVKNINAKWTTTGGSGVPSGWDIKYYDGKIDKYIISLTISGKSYKAEDGSTWAEWVDSSYNTDGFTISDISVLSSGGGVVIIDDTPVISTDVIASNGVYTIQATE